MTGLEGFQLYRTIEHPNETDSSARVGVSETALIPYGNYACDPRTNPEAAKKLAA